MDDMALYPKLRSKLQQKLLHGVTWPSLQPAMGFFLETIAFASLQQKLQYLVKSFI
jgi:hypothetical protein